MVLHPAGDSKGRYDLGWWLSWVLREEYKSVVNSVRGRSGSEVAGSWGTHVLSFGRFILSESCLKGFH